MKYCIASAYPSIPRPLIEPTHFEAMKEVLRYSSRASTLDMCTSTTGMPIAATASAMANMQECLGLIQQLMNGQHPKDL